MRLALASAKVITGAFPQTRPELGRAGEIGEHDRRRPCRWAHGRNRTNLRGSSDQSRPRRREGLATASSMGDFSFVGSVPSGTVTFLFTDVENVSGRRSVTDRSPPVWSTNGSAPPDPNRLQRRYVDESAGAQRRPDRYG